MARILRRSDLIASGLTGREITARVRSGTLIRIRRDHYAHVHVPSNHSRSRSPRDRTRRLTLDNRDGIEVHWHPLVSSSGLTHRVSILDALRQALRCQPPHLAVASIDNALFLGALRPHQLDALFAALPARLRALRLRVNGRSESGQESVLRWWLDGANLKYEIQVEMAGVGRIDFLVEGRLVIEADSKLAHSKWKQHLRDRNRDLALAQLGLATLRPHYAAIMFNPEGVMAAVKGLLAQFR